MAEFKRCHQEYKESRKDSDEELKKLNLAFLTKDQQFSKMKKEQVVARAEVARLCG